MQALFMLAGTPQSVNVTLLNSFATYNYHTWWHTTSLSAEFIIRRQHIYCINGKIAKRQIFMWKNVCCDGR